MGAKRHIKKMMRKIKNTLNRESASINDDSLLEWLGLKASSNKLTSEVTYFTCLKMLAETIGKLPIKYYQETELGTIKLPSNKVHRLLKNRPNKYMTSTTFWATVENNRNHYGNAYVWVRRRFKRQKYGGSYEVEDFWIMPSNDVEVIMDDKGIFGDEGGLFYHYSDSRTGKKYIFSSDEVMHFKTSMTFDGVMGVPVIEMLKSTIEGGLESQNFINNLYKKGLAPKLVLQYTGDLDDKLEKELVNTYEEYTETANKALRIIPVPIGMQLTPLNLKLTDSQFFELKKYTALQIAGAFGIKPNQINNYEKSSYSNSEMQQISFYVDTGLFIIKHYEEVINYHCTSDEEKEDNKFYKFNEKVILRTDAKTQQEILCAYVNNGILLVDEARNELDRIKVEGGDVPIVNGNYIKLKDVGKQWGTTKEQNKESEDDNKNKSKESDGDKDE